MIYYLYPSFSALTSPEGLAVDVARRRLFWVDSTPDKIETANLDGSDRRVLFDTDLVNPRAIIVDSPTGYVLKLLKNDLLDEKNDLKDIKTIPEIIN